MATLEELPEAYRRARMQTAHTFEMGGHTYSCHGLMPLEQIHMARRLAPLFLSALKPEGGRTAILMRLAKIANLSATEGPSTAANGQALNDAIELAISIFEAAAATDEETLNTIIRQVMGRIFRQNEGGGGTPMWNTKYDIPSKPDVDGFMTLAMVANYLVLEFKDRIAEYVTSLNLKPGPTFTAALNGGPPQQRPPHAPGA